MKKILLLFSILVMMFTSVNAVTQITSCGGVGWISGETYILNFSVMSVSPCLNFPIGTNYQDIKIIGSQPINVNINNGIFFINNRGQNDGINYAKYNITFENINLYSSNNYKLDSFFYTQSHLRDEYNRFNDGFFKNISINMDSLTFLRYQHYQFGSGGQNSGQFIGNTINNLYLPSSDYFYYQNFVDGGTQYSLINNNIINNSFINTNIKMNYLSNVPEVRTQNNYFYNSVVRSPVQDYAGNSGATSYYSGNRYYYGMNYGEPHIDVNDDSISDSDIYTNVFGGVVTLDLLGREFIQDFDEGLPFVNSGDEIVLNENIQIGSPDIFLVDQFTDIDTSLIFTLYDNINGFQMGEFSSLCYEPFVGDNCFMQDHSTPFTYSLEYKGLIRVNNNVNVNNLNFNKIYSTNNAHVISNPSSTLIQGVNIKNNNFLKADDNFKFLDNYIIKLNANNVNIENNIFNMTTSANNGYEVIQILGNDKFSNDIHLNQFLLNAPSSTTPTYIFTNNSRTKFYNNYLASNVEVHSDFNINIVQNPVITYETGGLIYYWTIGNYYEDNIGCVDGDSDNICDSPYTVGNYTDNYPLAVWPFVPENNLLTADLIVPAGEVYSVQLTNITEGETVNLNDGSETLTFGFIQNSSYPDLQCGYYLDAINFGGISNPLPDVVYYFDKTGGWTTKTYTLRVDCSNDQGTRTTGNTNFNVILSSQSNVCGNLILEGAEQCDDGNTLNGDGCSSICQFETNVTAICGNGIPELPEQCDDGNLLNGDGCSDLCLIEIIEEPTNNVSEPVLTNFNLFGGDISESSDNLNTVFEYTEQPLGFGIIIGMVFVGIAGLILLFAVVGLLLR